jgi:hypothetical protein
MLELLEIALFALILAIAGCACWIIRYVLVKLPEQQNDILGRFGLYIVNQVALQYSSLNETQQKQKAEEKMRDLFEDFGIAMPGSTAIEATIASAIYYRKREEYNIRFDKLPITPAIIAEDIL